jgi:hypothetical protein
MTHTHEYPHVTATVVADSTWAGARITTLHVWYPRFILAQLNTHGLLARSTRSSRAVPTKVLLDEARDNPVMPYKWLKNKKGMQGGEELTPGARACAIAHRRRAIDAAIEAAEGMASEGVAKETANRDLEPYLHAHTLVTATEWANFFALRLHHDAQPEFQALAAVMRAALDASVPVERTEHLPYAEGPWSPRSAGVSGARCARISYRPFEGETSDEADVERATKLWEAGHRSPFDHPATAEPGPHGRFVGWVSARMWLGDVGPVDLAREKP